MVFFVSVFDTKTCQQLVKAEAGFFIFIHFYSFFFHLRGILSPALILCWR